MDQTGRAEIQLELRRYDWRSCLVISVAPNLQAIYTVSGRHAGGEPSSFCMLLRKYLEGARVASVEQEGWSRRTRILFTMPPHLAYLTPGAALEAEFLGSRGNICLLDAAGGIIGCLGKALPPPPEKLAPDKVSESELMSWISASQAEVSIRKLLVKKVEGIGDLLAGEIIARAGLNADLDAGRAEDAAVSKLVMALKQVLEYAEPGKSRATVFSLRGDPVDFHCMELKEYADMDRRHFDSCLEASAYFWQGKRRQIAKEELRRRLESVVTRSVARLERKASLQLEEADRGKDADKYRLMGELLTAYSHLVPPRASSVRLPNYYDPDGAEITIPLNPSLSATGNAQVYFKKYRKAIASQKLAGEQLKKTREELEYLAQVEQALSMTDDEGELALLEEELISQGYEPPKKKRTVRKAESTGPRVFVTRQGHQVLVGRNNVQNDMITFKMSRDDDIWLHAKDCPGAHVILKKPQGDGDWPPEASLEEAAAIAAFYSKARFSSKVAVDWTPVQYVWKPRGARPGMVLYKNQRTVLVAPGCPKETHPISGDRNCEA